MEANHLELKLDIENVIQMLIDNARLTKKIHQIYLTNDTTNDEVVFN